MSARVLVTRPAHDAAAWVDALREHGLQAQALALMAIGPCQTAPARQALLAARAAVRDDGPEGARYRAVMFVSGNAVQHFFGTDTASPPKLASTTRAWTPGPGTQRALLALGMAPRQIDGPSADAVQFESETLWSQVRSQIRPGDRVLIVRGDSPPESGTQPPVHGTAGAGREWLAARLREAGAMVEMLAVYQRTLPSWSAQQQLLARQAASDGSVWLFSSSEAVANLQQLLPGQSWQQARALATHERIARQAAITGFGHVTQCRPTLEDVVASIESLT